MHPIKNLLLATSKENRKQLYLRDVFTSWLKYSGVYVLDYNLEVEYNSLYNCFIVSVFKDCRSIAGNGTKEERGERWESLKQDLQTLFPHSKLERDWRWTEGHHCYSDPQDSRQIEGVRFFVD